MRPVIGITLDWQAEGSFSKRPHYALRQGYFDAIWAAGGLPMAIPYLLEAQQEYLDRIDGLLMPGGDYPNPASWYVKPGEHPEHPRPTVDLAMMQKALDQNVPVLGICAGMQTMAVATGGMLYLRVVEEHPGAIHHRKTPLERRDHSIEVLPDSHLAILVGRTNFDVNSQHNEAIARINPPVREVAHGPDGVIEAIEIPGKRFALGLQWHPEFFTEPGTPDRLIFEDLVAAASERALQRQR